MCPGGRAGDSDRTAGATPTRTRGGGGGRGDSRREWLYLRDPTELLFIIKWLMSTSQSKHLEQYNLCQADALPPL